MTKCFIDTSQKLTSFPEFVQMCNLIFDQFTVSNKAKQIWLHITIWQLSEYIDILQNILGHSFPNHIYLFDMFYIFDMIYM